jgi:hypothetical protein
MSIEKDSFSILHELQETAEKKRRLYEEALTDYQNILLSINELLQEIKNKNVFKKFNKKIKNVKKEKNTENKVCKKTNFILDLLQKDRSFIRETITEYPYGTKGLKITEINRICKNKFLDNNISLEEIKKVIYVLLEQQRIERTDEGRYSLLK